jgi:hypothetical protein
MSPFSTATIFPRSPARSIPIFGGQDRGRHLLRGDRLHDVVDVHRNAAGMRPEAVVGLFGADQPLRSAGHPFFGPRWRADEVGMVLDAAVDWDEVAELLTESYCVLAPKKLVELVDRPTD